MSKPHWKDAPDWANWLAMDDDGSWFWYQKKPRLTDDHCRFIETGGQNELAVMDRPNLNWRETLEPRPTQLPEGAPELPDGYELAGRLREYDDRVPGLVWYPGRNEWSHHDYWNGLKEHITREDDANNWYYARRKPAQEGQVPDHMRSVSAFRVDESEQEGDKPDRMKGTLTLTIDAKEAAKDLKEAIQDAAPDLILPPDFYGDHGNMGLFAEDAVRQGYRIYWDAHGLRGWKG